MADPRFFDLKGPFTLGELAELTGAILTHPEKSDLKISNVNSLECAKADHIVCLHNPKYVKLLPQTHAGSVILRPENQHDAPRGLPLLISENPYLAHAKILMAFYPDNVFPRKHDKPQIHPSAQIDETAKIAANCDIQAGAVIGPNVEIGEGSFIGANAVINHGVVLGRFSYVGPNATVSYCLAGDHVVIHQGARVGRAGFGFAHDGPMPVRIPQIGRVILGNHVEIGANSTIDRGAIEDTIIGEGTMIDNLVQIGHNVVVGKSCVIVSQVGISGSTKVEDFVQLGGQVGIAGHITIGKGAKIAAQSGIMKDVDDGAILCGAPAIPIREFHKQTLTMWKLAKVKGTKL